MNPEFSIALITASLESLRLKRKRVASPANAETPKAEANTDNDTISSSTMALKLF